MPENALTFIKNYEGMDKSVLIENLDFWLKSKEVDNNVRFFKRKVIQMLFDLGIVTEDIVLNDFFNVNLWVYDDVNGISSLCVGIIFVQDYKNNIENFEEFAFNRLNAFLVNSNMKYIVTQVIVNDFDI